MMTCKQIGVLLYFVAIGHCVDVGKKVEQNRDSMRLSISVLLGAKDNDVTEFGGHYYFFTGQRTTDQGSAKVMLENDFLENICH